VKVTDIRKALAAAVRPVSGIEQSFWYMPGSINPPTFAVVEYDKSFNVTFGRTAGLKGLQITCMLWTSAGVTDAGQQVLDDYLDDGAGTVIAAIQADQTLGGTCGSSVVDSITGAGRLYAVGDVDELFLGAQINLRVWAT